MDILNKSQDHLLPNAASCNDNSAPIYFLHIPKTAGMTLNSYLRDIYNDFETFGMQCRDYSDFLLMSPEEISRKLLISGHFGAYIHAHYPLPLRYITFVRDPIERALSHYGHVMRDKAHYLHDPALELGSFSAYLRDPRTQRTIANYQVRHIAAELNPPEIMLELDKAGLNRHELENLIDTIDVNMSWGNLLNIAKARLDQMCFVGITERYSDSLRLLCEIFNWPHPQQLENMNTNPGRILISDLSTDDRKLLSKLNEEDIELYENAKSRFSRDWERSKYVYPKIHAFVSYAQNHEDVILHRVFKDVDAGTYVDVGANDPTGDSVTKAFYDRGWQGINIEPVYSLFKKLQEERTRDINLNIAAGAEPGEMNLFEIPGTGLSTLKEEIATHHQSTGFVVHPCKISIDTLTNVLINNRIEIIHFLKIDVEGAEQDVLQGMDFDRFRPWVIVIESTEPNSTVPVFQEWEHLITSHGYLYIHFDGLNRYYIAEEHEALSKLFEVPVNVTDHYIDHSQLIAETNARNAIWQLGKVQNALQTEAAKQVASLTEWATSADNYAKSLLAQHEVLQNKIMKLQAEIHHLLQANLADLEQALQLPTSSEHLYIRTGSIANKLRNYAAAETYYRQAISINWKNPHVYLGLAESLRGQGKIIESETYIRYFLQSSPETEGLTPNLPEQFDCNAYLELNPDIAEAKVHPIIHYLRSGRQEGRMFSLNKADHDTK